VSNLQIYLMWVWILEFKGTSLKGVLYQKLGLNLRFICLEALDCLGMVFGFCFLY
jgi:hypothetical protein